MLGSEPRQGLGRKLNRSSIVELVDVGLQPFDLRGPRIRGLAGPAGGR